MVWQRCHALRIYMSWLACSLTIHTYTNKQTYSYSSIDGLAHSNTLSFCEAANFILVRWLVGLAGNSVVSVHWQDAWNWFLCAYDRMVRQTEKELTLRLLQAYGVHVYGFFVVFACSFYCQFNQIVSNIMYVNWTAWKWIANNHDWNSVFNQSSD